MQFKNVLFNLTTSKILNAQIIPARLACLVMLTMGINPATAQTLTAEDPIIVTATRFQTSIAAAPVNVTVISSQQIDQSPARNLPQALENLGGVFVKDLFGVAGSKSGVDLGGFGATGTSNTLVLLNGRRLNDADLAGVNLDAIPLESVERIEIIRGNATVLYGDNATSGVINIVTKSGFDSSHSTIKAQAGSYNTQGLSINVSASNPSTAVLLAGHTLNSEGYRDNGAYENNSALLDISQIKGEALLGLRLNASDNELELPGPLNEPLYLENPRASTTSIEFANENRMTSELYFQNNNFAAELAFRNRNQNSLLFGDIDSDLKTLSFTPRYTNSFGINTVVAGIDLYKSSLDIDSNFISSGSHHRNETERNSFAFYVTDTLHLSQRTDINIGWRRQKVDVDVDSNDVTTNFTTSDNNKDILNSWDISFNHQFTPKLSGYVRLARGTRFPVLDEIWSFFTGTISLLQPQQSRHFELGSHINIDANHTLGINVFGIKLEDEIAYDPIQFANINLDPTQHEGFDIIYQGKLQPMWSLNAAYNYRRAKFNEGDFAGNEIPEIPRKRFTIAQQVSLDQHRQIGFDVVHTGKRHFGSDFNNHGKKMPAHTLLHVKYQQENNGWLFSVSVNNITNKKTADFGVFSDFTPNPYYYYALPERSYLVTIGTKW